MAFRRYEKDLEVIAACHFIDLHDRAAHLLATHQDTVGIRGWIIDAFLDGFAGDNLPFFLVFKVVIAEAEFLYRSILKSFLVIEDKLVSIFFCEIF